MTIDYEFDTIAAIATPFGTAGVGIVRLSGAQAFATVSKIFSSVIKPNAISYGWIINAGTKIDEAIVLGFKSPKSFTGEDVVEIQAHGGVNVLNTILDLVLKNGARLAERGEFTKRAFLNGKKDLTKVEAILDLIHAKTSKFAQKSANNLSGMLSTKIEEIRSEVFELLSKIIAAVDFPEDVSEPEYGYIEETISRSLAKIDKLIAVKNSSNLLRQGMKVVLAGAPNVGKSSLFNAFLSYNRAIVTDIAGTTRDAILETIDLDGLCVTFVDTAGLRDKADVDKVEAIGIEFSSEFIESADLVLFLYDLSKGMSAQDKQIFDLVKHKPLITVGTKSDLINTPLQNDEEVCVSTFDENSINKLKELIKQKITAVTGMECEYVTNNRQQDCLQRAAKSLLNALEATRTKQIQDLISIDVKSALVSLGEITGETISEDILANIFDNFCIGK